MAERGVFAECILKAPSGLRQYRFVREGPFFKPITDKLKVQFGIEFIPMTNKVAFCCFNFAYSRFLYLFLRLPSENKGEGGE